MTRPLDVSLPFSGPFTAGQAAAVGITPNSLTRRVANGEIMRLRRGVYAPSRTLSDVERIDATLLTAPRGSILGFEAAATLLKVPIPHSHGMQRVDLYVPSGSPHSGGRPQPEARLHFANLPAAQVRAVHGVSVTSIARTAVDLSRSQPFERMLIALDHARRAGVSLRALYDARYAAAGNRGVAKLDQALRHSSDLSESPLESMSRGVFVSAGVPSPTLQHQVYGASGRQYRVDFYWPRSNLIGEADGFSKYANDPASFRREKEREDDLRLVGFLFVRWTWDEIVLRPETVTRRIMEQLKRHA